MRTIDTASCVIGEGNATVFVFEHCTAECQGVRAALCGTRFEAMVWL